MTIDKFTLCLRTNEIKEKLSFYVILDQGNNKYQSRNCQHEVLWLLLSLITVTCHFYDPQNIDYDCDFETYRKDRESRKKEEVDTFFMFRTFLQQMQKVVLREQSIPRRAFNRVSVWVIRVTCNDQKRVFCGWEVHENCHAILIKAFYMKSGDFRQLDFSALHFT